MDEGLKFLESNMRAEYPRLQVGVVLKTATGVSIITNITYDPDRNELYVIFDNGQRIGANQIMRALREGLMTIVVK